MDGGEIGIDSLRAFESINQIDLVPTISMLLGLPIPFANIGGLVAELLPAPRQDDNDASFTPNSAVALALNAAQVWTYFSDYSKTSRDLPINRLDELKELLDSATLVYKGALSDAMKQDTANDSISFRQACSLYKVFLAESTDLGKRVWTQFNETGMALGIAILAFAWLAAFPLWRRSVGKDIINLLRCGSNAHLVNGLGKKDHEKCHVGSLAQQSISTIQNYRLGEVAVAIIFMIFQCGILTFGNSYIDSEREVIAFSLSALCMLVFRRWFFVAPKQDMSTYLPLAVSVCARLNDAFVTGHGLDPSIRLHAAHHSVVFLSSLLFLAYLRMRWLNMQSALADILAIVCLAVSWWEKRSRDHSRNGFYMARLAIAFTSMGVLRSMHNIFQLRKERARKGIHNAYLALYRVMMFVVIVTGPSTASTGVLIVIQTAALIQMMNSSGMKEVDAPVMAAIWRLAIRHVFFATNHHCSFNRLHFSAAFVATNTFMFHIAGSSLFMNTFGWEVIGSILVMALSRCKSDRSGSNQKGYSCSNQRNVWYWFLFYQWTETLSSCISVSLMKRHLMVWAIFAPRFMFAAIFTALNLALCFVVDLVVE